MRALRNILVTGGAGFIGVNFVRYLMESSDFSGRIVVADKLTYAGNVESLAEVAEKAGKRYAFERVDICDREAMQRTFENYEIDTVVHFAAESHVDRSIVGPAEFVNTNVVGTFSLLEAARRAWDGRSDVLFHHVSTDEVYGSLGDDGAFTETTPYSPRSPYSATKAASDHLVRAYYHTYSIPITVSNCSNNYGPYQFPEKLIPLMILNLLDGKSLPVYGEGKNVRDWLYVGDHASAIWAIITRGKDGETYNVGGETERRNIDLVNRLCEVVAEEIGESESHFKELIRFVPDRPGHDLRYAIDCMKIKRELGWRQEHELGEGLRTTVRWYLEHGDWVAHVRSGEYASWIDENYTWLKRG